MATSIRKLKGTTDSPRSARSDRKKQRDKRVAALSLDLVPQKNQWTTRIATQVLLADELHEAIILCLKAGLLRHLQRSFPRLCRRGRE
jgi:hypothetical protein